MKEDKIGGMSNMNAKGEIGYTIPVGEFAEIGWGTQAQTRMLLKQIINKVYKAGNFEHGNKFSCSVKAWPVLTS